MDPSKLKESAGNDSDDVLWHASESKRELMDYANKHIMGFAIA